MSGWLILSALLACTGETQECSESSKIRAFVDEDRDGYGDSSKEQRVCTLDVTLATVGGDCDDTRSNVNPVALEQCDGLDNDCDQSVDEDLRQLEFYEDADGDGFGDPSSTTMACSRPPGFVENPFDCWDDDELSNPAATEFCDGKDNNCDGLADDRDPLTDRDTMPTWYFDSDQDGYGDPTKFLQQCAQPNSSVLNGDDCDDKNAQRRPGAGEICNGVDDDCDGQLDDSDADLDPAELVTFYADYDGDGFGDPSVSVDACDPPWFFTVDDTDCDDAEPLLQDPSTGFWVLDGDGDGFGAPGGTPQGPSCTPPTAEYVLAAKTRDCDDANPANFPGAIEVCDTVDNDCDGIVDDADPDVDLSTGATFFVDTDGDGFGVPDMTVVACAVPAGASALDTDCDDGEDTIFPTQVEVCNGYDDNCDGRADEADPALDVSTLKSWFLDYDGDGWGDPTIGVEGCTAPRGYVDNDLDCDDNDPNGGTFVTWVRDQDGDGYGAGAPQGPSCLPPQANGWVPERFGLDCDDAAPDSFPGAEDICEDGIDQDCDLEDAACPVVLPDTCAEAEVAARYTTGAYALFGDFSDNASDVNFPAGNACTGGSTSGADAMVPITLQPGEVLKAAYVNDLDASLVLVTSCTAPNPNTCTAGADNIQGAAGIENLWFQNPINGKLDLYLILDCDGACGEYTLDLVIEPVVTSFLPDTCAQAQAAAPLETGGYTLVGRNTNTMANDIADPSICTGFAANGRESFVPVTLLVGESITVRYTQAADDASTYLLTDCASVATCVEGADSAGTGGSEAMTYTNTGVTPDELYLAFDCYTGAGGTPTCRDFEATITID